MTIYFAADHAGFELKQVLVPFVRDELGYDVIDCGAYAYDPADDYPDFVHKAARNVAANPGDARAIVLGKSGQGEAMAANHCTNVRAAVYYGGPAEIVTLSREHNDANVLSLGAGFLGVDEAKDVVRTWLETAFSGDARHVRRNKRIEQCAL